MNYVILVKNDEGEYFSTDEDGTMTPLDNLPTAKKLLEVLENELNINTDEEELMICEIRDIELKK